MLPNADSVVNRHRATVLPLNAKRMKGLQLAMTRDDMKPNQ